MLAPLALSLVFTSIQVERGRDPWVFRAVFEDRPKSVIVAAGNGYWFAFNPATCAFHKIWKGEIDLLGKVYDFSQDNSHSKGEILAKSYDEIFVLPNGELPKGWTSNGVNYKEGWVFTGDGATITSPEFDLSGYDNLYIAFDEKSKKGRLRIEVLHDEKVAEYFQSSTDVSSDTNWMWNFKYLLDRGEKSRIQFKQDRATDTKMMRSARMFGDRPGWALQHGNSIESAIPKFLGYQVDGTRSCRIFFEIVGKKGSIRMEVRPEILGSGSQSKWTLSYRIMEIKGGVHPVMLGWNDHLSRSKVDGQSVSFRGLNGLAIKNSTFVISGGEK